MSVSSFSCRARRTALVAAMVAIVQGCREPTMRPWPQPQEMQLFMILDPDQPSQPMLVSALGNIEGDHDTKLGNVTAELSLDGAVLAAESTGEFLGDGEYNPCIERIGGIVSLGARCVNFDFTPQPGGPYEIEVTHAGRPTARATTIVPAPFTIVSHEVQGTLPGTARLRATWTQSAGTHRYVVAIRGRQREDGSSCSPDSQCFSRWFLSTADTTVDVIVDAKYFEEAVGPWFLDVYAMNRDVYGYLMTVGSNELFPVPPRQNVIGGYGSVGAWVRRGVPIM